VCCESAQGFYFAPALPPHEMASLLCTGIVGSAPDTPSALKGA
jgi:hypothetical protein